MKFPQKATHKSFGEITLLGVRIECSSNNNTMYFFKLNGEYVWGYDYEISLTPINPEQDVEGGEIERLRAEEGRLKGQGVSVDESGAIAVAILERSQPDMTAQEQALFVAGFQECIKWIKRLNPETIKPFPEYSDSSIPSDTADRAEDVLYPCHRHIDPDGLDMWFTWNDALAAMRTYDSLQVAKATEGKERDEAEFTKKVVKDLIIYQDELAAAKERIAELKKQIEYLNIR